MTINEKIVGKFCKYLKNNGKYKEKAPPRATTTQFWDPFLERFGAFRGALEGPWGAKWHPRTPFFNVFFDVQTEELIY